MSEAPHQMIDPSKLPSEFKKFRNDELYFIGYCTYYAQPNKSVRRIIALTPVAVFITDAGGSMDRATRYELIASGTHQRQTRKKLLTTEETITFLLDIPKEFDCLFSMDAGTSNAGAVQRFVERFEWLCRRKKETFAWRTVEPTAPSIADAANFSPPSNYVNPRDIIKGNKEREELLARLEAATKQVEDIRREVGTLDASIATKTARLAELEGCGAEDTARLRVEKDSIQGKFMAHQKRVMSLEIELLRVRGDVSRLEEQLQDDARSRQALADGTWEETDTTLAAKQREMVQLRQKAQQRESDKLQTALLKLEAQLATLPVYQGPEALVNRALSHEKSVAEALKQWSTDMESVCKVDKFLGTCNAEIERCGRVIVALHAERQKLIDARRVVQQQQQTQSESREVSAPLSTQPQNEPPTGGIDDLLDDPLEGPTTTSTVVAPPAMEDDLL